jgi:thiol-disulfide isomerase/thioredoxin
MKVEIMKKHLLFILFYLLFPFFSTASDGCSVKLYLPQLDAGQDVYLGYYWGEKRLLLDTAITDKKGHVHFERKENLPGGMYFAVISKKKNIEFLLSEDRKFTITVKDTARIIESAQIKGSLENELLYEYQRYMSRQSQKFRKLQNRREQNEANPDSLQRLDEIAAGLEKETEQHWKALADKYSGTLFAKILKGMNIKSADATRFGYFFDDVDFSDERLLRSPVIYKSIQHVLARNLNRNRSAEFIIQELKQLISKSEADAEVYQYTVSYLLNFFNSFQRVGMNRVFVFIAENYVLNGQANWFSEAALESIGKRTAELRAAYVGSESPNLVMESLKGDTLELHSIKKPYTLVFFWSSGCGHCESAAESIRNFMQTAVGERFAVYSVFTKDFRRDWEQAVDEFQMQDWNNVWDPKNSSNYRNLYYVVSTPLLYVLNDDKTIIGFRAGDGPILDLLDELQK